MLEAGALWPRSSPSMKKFGFKRVLRSIWNRTGRRIVRRIELDIMRRSLDLPNLHIPSGRRSAVDLHGTMNDAEFTMDQCTHEIAEELRATFPSEKIAHFHRMVDDPYIDFVVRMRSDGECWGFMMHSLRPFKDPLYRFTVPIAEDETFQFDGWVHPDYRGRLIAVVGTNWVFDRRRAAGTKAVVVTVRQKDHVAQRYHKRFSFEKIGRITHWKLGPFRFNRIKMDRTAQTPTDQPDQARQADPQA